VSVKDNSRLLETQRAQRREVVRRFALSGGAAGLCVGLFEAALLYFIPRVPALLEPDVRFVIWFLAPPIALVFVGLLGLALGWAAARGKSVAPRRSATLATAMLGIVAAYVAATVSLLPVRTGDTLAIENVAAPAVWFVVVFAYALFIAQAFWGRVAHLFDPGTPGPFRLLAKTLAAAMVICALGLGFHVIKRPSGWAAAQASPSPTARRPNIVLITLDTARADHLSAYGYHRLTTPNLDRLASQGVLFENAISPSSWTLPSHASILTGLLPHQHGANSGVPLGMGLWTLAEVLKSHGYETVGFNANIFYGLTGWGMGQGFAAYEDDSSSLQHNLAATLVGRVFIQTAYQYLCRYDFFERRDARNVNRDVLRWFRRRPSRPFFLFINYFDVHNPYLAPAPYDRRFGQISEPLARQVNSMIGVNVPKPLSEEEQRSLIAGYDNCLAFLDDQVGRLVQSVDASPEGSDTIFIVTSDHGEAFGEHGLYDHGLNLYREALHVPLIIFGPGIPRGLRIAHIARIREIFPTVLDLVVGERLPFRRASLRRFWSPDFRPQPFDEVAVSELAVIFPVPISLMTSEWHYLHNSRGEAELYHWPTDRQEKINLAGSPQHQRILQALRERLVEHAGLSLRPWRGPRYLLGLDRADYSFLRETAFGHKLPSSLPATDLRVGASQAYFAPAPSATPSRPQAVDEELIKSLPYH